VSKLSDDAVTSEDDPGKVAFVDISCDKPEFSEAHKDPTVASMLLSVLEADAE